MIAVNERAWADTQTELRRLETLLPPTPASGSDQSRFPYDSLPEAEKLAGWRRWMAMMIRRGWRLGDDGQLHREKASSQPQVGGPDISRPAQGFVGPWRAPWDPKYNPRLDAPAAIFGATYIGPNRYRYGMQLLDANGAQRNEGDECPVCGCTPKDSYRVVRVEHPNPYVAQQQPWIQAFEPCPRCAGNRV